MDNAATAPTVLVIDPDPVSRRFVEIALGRADDLRLLAATEGEAALELLSHERIDLVLSETALPDLDGLQLLQRLQGESRLRALSFVFLSADTRPRARRAAFAAGADDYLVKPCDGDLLLTRIRALLDRQRRAEADRRRDRAALAGRLSEISLIELASLLEQGRRTGVLFVAGEQCLGTIYVHGGRVVHARTGDLAGAAAFTHLARLREGDFELVSGELADDVPRTMADTTQVLVARTWRALTPKGVTSRYVAVNPEAAAAEAELANAAQEGTKGPAASLLPAFVPDTTTAAQLAHGIEDPFALGEIMGFSFEELASWTRSEATRERFHVILAADVSQGVSSMLTLGGAPTEKWVMGTLSSRQVALGLTFYLRRERVVDVLLVDIQEPAKLREALGRAPSLLIAAPPSGDARTVSLKARVELAELVTRLAPPAMLIAGDPSLRKTLRSSFGSPQTEMSVRSVAAAFGEPRAELRTLLGQGIRLCAEAAETGAATISS